MSDSDVKMAKARVDAAQRTLEGRKKERDQAKKNGNYKASPKNIRWGSKVGNVYDNNVWSAEQALKDAKDDLAKTSKSAKKREKKKKRKRSCLTKLFLFPIKLLFGSLFGD